MQKRVEPTDQTKTDNAEISGIKTSRKYIAFEVRIAGPDTSSTLASFPINYFENRNTYGENSDR
jgi:hypothetical protein